MSSEGDSNAHIVEEEDGKYLHVNSHAKIVEATPVLEWMFTGSSAVIPISTAAAALLIAQRLEAPDMALLDYDKLTDEKWRNLIDDMTAAGTFEQTCSDRFTLEATIKSTHALLAEGNQVINESHLQAE